MLERAATRQPRHNLPRVPTSFVGREREVAEVLALVEGGTVLTLTGPGGCGKTRLALRVAERALDAHADGTWLVDLAPLTDPTLVAATAAAVAGAREDRRPPLDVLVESLRDRAALLLLDNCEHVLSAAAELVHEVVGACPTVAVVCTSREPLGLTGERRWQVPPMSLPDAEGWAEGQVAESDAVRLFVERARLASNSFALTAENAESVARLCRRLDGLPLALELAAARVGVMSLRQLDERLGGRLQLLRSDASDVPARQRTLRALSDWSWEMLTVAEREMLARLSVFAGGFDLDAVEAICAGGAVAPDDVVDVFMRLVERSLIAVEDASGSVRHRMLDTIRRYAAGRLDELGESEAVRRRHADWFTALADQSDSRLQGADQSTWLERLELDRDNFRVAFAAARDEGDRDVALRLAAGLGRFWDMRGHFTEGRRTLTEALAVAPDPGPLRARALGWAGNLAEAQGETTTALSCHEEALAFWRSVGDKGEEARSLSSLANAMRLRGDVDESQRLHADALEIRREIGDEAGVAASLNNLGNVLMARGSYAAARPLYEESAEAFRRAGNTWARAKVLCNLAETARLTGDVVSARPLYEEAASLVRDVRDPWQLAVVLLCLGALELDDGDLDRAVALTGESLQLLDELGDEYSAALCHAQLGEAAAQLGRHDVAKSHLGRALVAARRSGNRLAEGRALRAVGEIELSKSGPSAAWSLYRDALSIYRDVSDDEGIVLTLKTMAASAASVGDAKLGSRLWGCATGIAEAVGLDRLLVVSPPVPRDASWREGRSLSRSDAVAGALSWEPTAEQAGGRNVFRRGGDVWTIVYGGSEVRLNDTKGLAYISILLRDPFREVHVLELVASVEGHASTEDHTDPDVTARSGGDAGALLDDRARDEYRRRLDDLREELEEARRWRDDERAARTEAEIEFVARELAAAFGLGGRARKAGDTAERARKAVYNRIRQAVGRIRRENPSLGTHLEKALRTGVFCSYTPERPTVWET